MHRETYAKKASYTLSQILYIDFLLGLVQLLQLLGLAGTRTPASLDAWCNIGLFIVIGLGHPRLKLPYEGDLNADTEVLLSGGRSLSTSSHPTVLASQVAWITGESQFSRL